MTSPLVLLDLDGTLMDSAPGIIASAVVAFEAVGMPIPDDGAMRALIGPAITTSFPAYGVPADRMDEAVAAFRQEFRERGMWNNSVYDGIPAQLSALRSAGCMLVIATGKPAISAEPICERFGLTGLVDGIYGTPPDGRETKAQVIAKALAGLGRVAGDGPMLMVGDRLHDVEGAREHGISTLGVSWGYAPPGELAAAGAVAVIDDVADLASTALSLLRRTYPFVPLGSAQAIERDTFAGSVRP